MIVNNSAPQPGLARLDKELDEAGLKGSTVVDVPHDWKRAFPFDWTNMAPSAGE